METLCPVDNEFYPKCPRDRLPRLNLQTLSYLKPRKGRVRSKGRSSFEQTGRNTRTVTSPNCPTGVHVRSLLSTPPTVPSLSFSQGPSSPLFVYVSPFCLSVLSLFHTFVCAPTRLYLSFWLHPASSLPLR